MKIANRAFTRFRDNFELLWRRYDVPMPPVLPAGTFEGIHETGHFYADNPAGARDWATRHRAIGGINYMALEMCFGDMTPEEAIATAELFAAEAMPTFTPRT